MTLDGFLHKTKNPHKILKKYLKIHQMKKSLLKHNQESGGRGGRNAHIIQKYLQTIHVMKD